MTQRVVEALEIVQIDEEDRPPPPVAGARRQCLLQPVQQEPPVGQPGQGIVERQLLDVRLCRLALGDVDERADEWVTSPSLGFTAV